MRVMGGLNLLKESRKIIFVGVIDDFFFPEIGDLMIKPPKRIQQNNFLAVLDGFNKKVV